MKTIQLKVQTHSGWLSLLVSDYEIKSLGVDGFKLTYWDALGKKYEKHILGWMEEDMKNTSRELVKYHE